MSINLSRLEKLYRKDRIPFSCDDSCYARFPEFNTIFKRVRYDESFHLYNRSITEREDARVGLPGYHRADYAVRSASWTLYDYFDQAFSLESVSENEELSPTSLVSNLPKFETTDLGENSKYIKNISYLFGAVETGISIVDERFIYSHDYSGQPIFLPKGMNYVIVMLVAMDYDAIKTSPTLPASITTGIAYSKIAFLVSCLAEAIRGMGYSALSCGNDTALSVPLAVEAGLGQFGRNGLLINRKLGQALRICKVFTDFPLRVDKPVRFGVPQFCRVCKKCAEHCPSKSISFDRDPSWSSPWSTPSNNSGVYKWYVNVETCYEYWLKNSTDCSNCIRVCPFTKPPGVIHDVVRFFIKYFPIFNRIFVCLDNLFAKVPFFRYGVKQDAKSFWKKVNKKVKK
jgi:epoxyqueuosine reductase